MSVGAAPLVADLRHLLLPGYVAFGVVFVISLRLLNNVFTLPIRPIFAGGAGCLLVLNIVDFLFRWLGVPNCLYVRTDETFTERMSHKKPDDYIVVLLSRTGLLGCRAGACRREGGSSLDAKVHQNHPARAHRWSIQINSPTSTPGKNKGWPR